MKILAVAIALCACAAAAAQAPLDPAQPSMSGIWHRVGYSAQARPDNAQRAPLLPTAARRYAEHRASAAHGDRSFDSSSYCLPEGIPRLMLKAEPFEILQRPSLVSFNYQINRLSRVAYLGASADADDDSSYLGSSTAHWEGPVLVIATRGFNDLTLLDDSGLPHSEALKVVERLELGVGARQLIDHITVEDPETFARSWSMTVRYERIDNYRMPEDVCAEKIGGSRPHAKPDAHGP